MRKIIITLFLILFFSCSKNDPPVCNYCKSKIYYQESEKLFLMTSPRIIEDGKYYHPWCYKIKVLESKLDSLKRSK